MGKEKSFYYYPLKLEERMRYTLKYVAKTEGRSINSLIELSLKKYLNKYKTIK